MKKNIGKQTKTPVLNKKKGCILGCLLGFVVSFLYVFNELDTNPLAGILFISVPLVSITCGIAGIIIGGSYSQIKVLLENSKIDKTLVHPILYIIYAVHLLFLFLPLYIIGLYI